MYSELHFPTTHGIRRNLWSGAEWPKYGATRGDSDLPPHTLHNTISSPRQGYQMLTGRYRTVFLHIHDLTLLAQWQLMAFDWYIWAGYFYGASCGSNILNKTLWLKKQQISFLKNNSTSGLVANFLFHFIIHLFISIAFFFFFFRNGRAGRCT